MDPDSILEKDPEAVFTEQVQEPSARGDYTLKNNQHQSVDNCQMIGKPDPVSQNPCVSSLAKSTTTKGESKEKACVLINKFKNSVDESDQGVLPTLTDINENQEKSIEMNEEDKKNAQKNRGITEEDMQK